LENGVCTPAIEAVVADIVAEYSFFSARWDCQGQEMEYPLIDQYRIACSLLGSPAQSVKMYSLTAALKPYLSDNYKITLGVPGATRSLVVLVILRDHIRVPSRVWTGRVVQNSLVPARHYSELSAAYA